ncbi:lytic transglycosylase domain-containing protein [Breoghania sp. L-A4]|uniref:lytic transglycosylase domain-containing protein n=1 Tax=Breoghania sp. L-A4 TaxID=2304600 RepID=UPI000E35B7C3|nr:lytic transglycosylase domain-containing protein [Breoghania sp. L-A4]AXS41671.1 tetratricopeptide repeat protein [Breoghania sp. L-A4]
MAVSAVSPCRAENALPPPAFIPAALADAASADAVAEAPRGPLYVVTDEAAFVKNVCERIEREANAHGLPPGFLARLIWTESRFDPNAISPMGAEGIAQFMPATARVWGLANAFEPMAAISASATLLGSLNRGYGNLGLAAAAYNAGENRVDAWRAGHGRLPLETRNYVHAITGHSAGAWNGKDLPDVRFMLDETQGFQESCTEMPLLRAPMQRRFANTYFNRGLALANAKKFREAIVRYSVAIRLKPGFPHAYNNRGIAYRRLGDLERAIANYDAAIRLKPDYAAAYNNRGYARRKLGQFEEAVADYDQALRLKPDYDAARFNRGFAHSQLRRFDAAIADYSIVLKRQPKHALALYNRALARIETGETEAALTDFDRVIAARPGFARAYFRRAELLQQLGHSERARKDYARSVALNAGFADERYRVMFD